jgi:hypothetical protein
MASVGNWRIHAYQRPTIGGGSKINHVHSGNVVLESVPVGKAESRRDWEARREAAERAERNLKRAAKRRRQRERRRTAA